MCGIAGMIDRGSAPCIQALRRAAARLVHRGPDSEGFHLSGPVGLAHRRLGILDLSEAGRQPMRSDDGRLTVVYCGEIYNYRTLRETLKDRRPLRSRTDTEVLLRCYEESGAACVRSFNGMFAFAMLDERAGEVVLARDPWGIKPLYFASDGRRFYFASEIKAILAMGFKTAPDDLAVLNHLFTAWTADDRTLFQGITRLPPGSLLRYALKDHSFTVEQYFRPKPDWSIADRLGDDRGRWVDAVDRELQRSVRDQLESDVPVGTYCSGGLDSSLITAIAAKSLPDVQAFNVTCPDTPACDEGPFAERLTSALGVNLHRLTLTRENFREALVRTVYGKETPLMVVNAVALHLVSATAHRAGVKVMLSGEGADELFGGYVDHYRRNAIQRTIRARGPIVGGLVARIVRTLDALAPLLGMTAPGDGMVPGAHELFTGGMRRWTSRSNGHGLYSRYTDPLDRELAADLHSELSTYLPPLLQRADRASMGASVELRVPFLDMNMVALALATPPSMKVGVRGFRPYGKRLLREVAVRHIPQEMAYRPKMGFMIPPSYYLGPWPKDWLTDGFVVDHFRLRPSDLDAWLRAQTDQSACWMLTLEMWGQLFDRGRAVDAVAEEFLAATVGAPARGVMQAGRPAPRPIAHVGTGLRRPAGPVRT